MTGIINEYHCENLSFYNADCMDLMKTFKDKEFNLAIVDPPYGIGAENHAGNADNGWKQWDKKSWDSATPDKAYFDELFRISKNQIIWGGNYFANLLPNSQGWIFWDKGQRAFSLADGELCWTSFKKSLRVFEMARAKVKASIGYDKIHPTQKPVALYEWILKNYSEPNQKIIDTHLGSGSIAIAIDKANQLDKKNLSFVGIELDPDYFNAAIKRIKNSIAQTVIQF